MTVLKEKKVEKVQDTITNRVLLFFGFTAVFLWAISYLSRAFDYQSSHQAARIVSLILLGVGVVGIVGGLALQISRSRSGKAADASVTGCAVMWFSLVLALSCAMMRFYDYVLTMRLLYVLLPVAAILYLIYYIYPREFFTVCTTHAALSFCMWALAKTAGDAGWLRYGAFAIGAVICIVFFALAFTTRKSGGCITLSGKKLQIFSAKTSAAYLACVYGVPLLLFIAALALGVPFAFYALYVIIAYIIAAAVYYTVRML